MKNIEEKILMADEEIKQLQNKRKKLISQQKQEERKKRDRRIYEKGAVFESIFTESKEFSKDEFWSFNKWLFRKMFNVSGNEISIAVSLLKDYLVKR